MSAGHDQAQIFDQGYRPFEGTLAPPSLRFLVIARNQLRLAWKEKWFRRLVIASFFPLVGFAVVVVIQARFGALIGEIPDLWVPFWGLQSFFAMITVYFIGRSAVGEDLRTGALVIYFSRPVSFRQYLGGKWLAMAIGIGGVTLLPGLVLSLFRWLAAPDVTLGTFLGWAGSLILLSALLGLAMGWCMLAISSLTSRGRAAGIIWVIVYFVSGGVADGLAQSFGIEVLQALSIITATETLANYFLHGQGTLTLAAWAILGQLGWAGLSLAVVLVRLRRWVGY